MARLIPWLVGVSLIVVFLIDLTTPRGVSIWFFYLLPLLCTYGAPSRTAPLIVAAVGTGLTGLGFFLAPPGIPVWLCLLNRSMGLSVLWLTAFLIRRLQRTSAESKLAGQVASADLARLRGAIESAPMAVAMFDCEMRYLAASRRWHTDYRLPDAEVTGRSHYDVFPEMPERWKEIHRRCLAGATEKCDEDRFDRQDGSTDWIRWEVRPWRTVPGEIGGIIIYSEDISARKRIEETLQQTRRSLEQAQARARIGSWEVCPATGRGWWSPEMFRMFGRDPAVGVPSLAGFFELVHPKDRAPVLAANEAVMRDGERRALEFRGLSDGGRVRHYLGIVDRVDLPDGTRILAGTTQEITEHKLAENALAESHHRVRSILDNLFEFVGLYSLDGILLETNRAPLEAFGLRREDVIGKPFLDMAIWQSMPEGREQIREALARAARGETVKFESELRLSGGDVVAVDSVVAPVRDARGNVFQVVGSAVNVTARKRVEAELRATGERLAALSRRLIRLQEEERRGVARELHDEIGQVLTAVLISVQRARAADSPDAFPELAESETIVDRAIRQVRDISLNLRPAMLDDFGLVAAVRWYVERLRPKVDFRIEVEARSCGLPLASEVNNMAFRVIQEALTNVQRHARAREARVSVEHTESALELRVSDDGVGFDPAAVNARAVGGESLGVLGMRERVELLGGEFRLDSAPGRGTTVHARLTVQPPAGESAPPALSGGGIVRTEG